MAAFQELRRVKNGLATLLSWAIYGASFFTPRERKIWIFIGWHKNSSRETFADNSKYLFLHISHTRKDIEAIWIGADKQIAELLRNKGYKSYSIDSFWGIYYSLRARYTIIDALLQTKHWRYSGRSKVIQLWHADGIKGLDLGGQWSFKRWRDIIFSPGLFKKIYFFIASSEYIAQNFICPSFKVPLEKVRITGLPRYDVFFRTIPGSEIDLHSDLKRTLENIQRHNPKKKILYAPTFRRNENFGFPLAHVELEKFNEYLLKRAEFLFISLHPKFSTVEWIPHTHFSNIFFINPEYDHYPLLPSFDLVITDYSSICLEFLLLDKPAIFYTYDLEEYKKDPGLPEKFWNLVPGPRVKDFNELLEALSEDDNRASERERVRNTLFTFKKGEASENVALTLSKELV